MIGHDVEHQSHAPLLQFVLEFLPLLFRTQLGIDACRIGHVVSMLASFAAAQDRRNVNIRDTQFGQVIKNRARICKPEVLVELQTIGCDRNACGRHVRAEAREFAVEPPDESVRRSAAGQRGRSSLHPGRFARTPSPAGDSRCSGLPTRLRETEVRG